MKYINFPCYTATIFVSAVLWTGLLSARANVRDLQQAQEQPAQPAEPPEPPSSAASGQNSIVIQTIEPDGKSARHKDVAWLGVAVEETSDALSSQLGLKPGEGLTVDLLAEGSPAAKADLRPRQIRARSSAVLAVRVSRAARSGASERSTSPMPLKTTWCGGNSSHG